MPLLGIELADDRLARGVAQAGVLGVDADQRAEDRVIANEPAETCLDELIELVVKRSQFGRRGSRQLEVRSWDQTTASASGRVAVSAKAARVASITVSMSAAVTS